MHRSRTYGLNIVQKFSILSFLWVFLFVIVSGWVLNYYLKQSMADVDGGITTSIWLLSVGGGLLFYISFFGLFYKAYKTQKEMDEGIHRLNRELSDLNVHLENIVDERTLALKRSRDDIQAIFDAVTDIIVVKDLDSNIEMANRSAAAVFNRGHDGIVGEKCYRLFWGGDSPCPGCPISETLVNKRSASTEVTNIHNGEVFDLSIFPVIDEKGKVQKVIEYAKVVTPQKRLENKVIQMEKLSTLGSLVGEIAHQINNPLVGVVNTAQLALMQVEEGSLLKEDLKGIEKAGIECKRIIRKFLDFTRPARFKLSPVNINTLLEDSLEVLEKQLRLKNIAIERKYGEGIPAVDVDTTLMTQVFFNIITNAKDAMPDGGRLTISTFPEGPGSLGISFSDTGTGIKGEDMAKIFSPFFTTKGEGAGTGLGLSVAANIIRSHSGRIYAESKVGEGTTVHIRLPLSREASGNG